MVGERCQCWATVGGTGSRPAGAPGASHRFTVAFQLPVAIRCPSGLKATLFTYWLPGLKARTCCPDSASQMRTVPSRLVVTRRVPSGL